MPSPKPPAPDTEPGKTADEALTDALASLRGPAGPLIDPGRYDIEDIADAVMDALDRDGYTVARRGS